MMSRTPADHADDFDFRRADYGRGAQESLLWKLRRPVVPAAKRAIRRYGSATSARRVLPNYLLIGAKRGGSTTLARSLADSPGVQSLFPRREALKGTYFFDVNYAQGESWYRSHFPTSSTLGSDLVGDASPYYLSHPHAAARARQLVPDARILCVLRDPVERAFSHYRERVKQGIETLPSFEDALDAEPDRLAGELDRMIEDPMYVSWNHLNFGYMDQSRYSASLGRWLERFPLDQVHVIRSEEMYADPLDTLQNCRQFLGLSAFVATPQHDLHQNKLPNASLAPATRQRLWREFATDVERLAALLDEPVWWTTNQSSSGAQNRKSRT